MKVTVNVDCTPEEARAFFGLPDVAPMQEAIMREVQDRVLKNMAAMDVDTLMRVWLPKSIEGFDQIQKAFWSGMSDAMRGGDKRS
ncbi:MAG TPA: DUF6489 family protein [Methylomirabilota bacterium]|jgi:uncharacterized protein DUF6489|nr:DUF6489 family protein [Methylomirabilota bacterium]